MAACRFFMRDPIVILLGPGSNGGCFIPKSLLKKPFFLAADELFAPAAYQIQNSGREMRNSVSLYFSDE